MAVHIDMHLCQLLEEKSIEDMWYIYILDFSYPSLAYQTATYVWMQKETLKFKEKA